MNDEFLHVPKQHQCRTPTIFRRVGTIWRCGTCGQHWRYGYSAWSFIMGTHFWIKISEEKAHKLMEKLAKES